ncbi:hypothetical protein ACHAXH_002114 [Discostella pseudostelligera]
MVTVKRKHAFTLTLPTSIKRNSSLFILVATYLTAWTLHLSYKISSSSTPSHPSLRVDTGGKKLPYGTVFTPDEFRAGNHDNYVNLPNFPIDVGQDKYIHKLMNMPVPPPAETLLHQPSTLFPPGSNAILGLASYPRFFPGWMRLVGSLRNNGYDGHIIMGVNPAIPIKEQEYLNAMNVTYYAVDIANCSASILDGVSNTGNAVRAICSAGLEDLKLEWGRFEMARRWLHACKTCTGWSMVIDTRDIFFQNDPFASLGDPSNAVHDLMLVEEVAQFTNTMPESPHRATNIGQSHRYTSHVEPCYGKENVKAEDIIDRPMLCSGTVLGTRMGIHRFLSVLVDEFQKNNNKGRPECRSPSTTDQWTMNYLYYRGQFGYIHQTKTLPWGTGPVLTMGKPCVNGALGQKNATSQKDMMVIDNVNSLVLNPHEMEDSPTRVAPALHQWDRCRGWFIPVMEKQMEKWPEYQPVS